MKELRVSIVLLGILVSIGLFFLFSPSVSQEKGIVYYLRPNTSKYTMISELTEQGVIQHPWVFSIFIYPQRKTLKVGEYFFPKGTSAYKVWKQLTTGTGLYYRAFTIIPGWSFNQLRKQLLATEYLKHATQGIDDNEIMRLLGSPNLPPEGEFFPETYYYTRGIPDLIILKNAFNLMQQKLNLVWNSRYPNLPYQNAYEALIAASMIEKEAYLNTERPMIAGVIINRLRKNMLLQIDPTVIYGMGERYTGKIHKENLLEDNAYNTYVHKGLPPTPIAMPSYASLEAATHPDNHDYYYFVAKGNGSHQFSKTLSEHNDAVQSAIKLKQ